MMMMMKMVMMMMIMTLLRSDELWQGYHHAFIEFNVLVDIYDDHCGGDAYCKLTMCGISLDQ